MPIEIMPDGSPALRIEIRSSDVMTKATVQVEPGLDLIICTTSSVAHAASAEVRQAFKDLAVTVVSVIMKSRGWDAVNTTVFSAGAPVDSKPH